MTTETDLSSPQGILRELGGIRKAILSADAAYPQTASYQKEFHNACLRAYGLLYHAADMASCWTPEAVGLYVKDVWTATDEVQHIRALMETNKAARGVQGILGRLQSLVDRIPAPCRWSAV